MAKQLQLFFDRKIANEQKAKDIKRMFEEALRSSQSYLEAKEVFDKAKEKVKNIKEAIMNDFYTEKDKLDLLKTEIEHDKLLLSDKALADLVAGKTVEVEDEHGNKYVPEFIVKFKKV